MCKRTLTGAQLFHQKVRGCNDRREFGWMYVAAAQPAPFARVSMYTKEECNRHEWPTIHHRNPADAKMRGAAADSAAHAERGARACVAWPLGPSSICRPSGGRARGPLLASLCISAGGRPVATPGGRSAPPSTGILVPLRHSEGLLPLCPAMPWRLEASGPQAIAVGGGERCSRNGSC
jgi:hypothetical protein